MSKWIPDRKVWAGGLFTVLAFLIILALNTWADADIPMEAGFFLSIALGKIGEYFLPPTLLDIIKRLDNDVVAAAAASPDSQVSPQVGRAAMKAATSDDTFDALMRRMKGGA